MKTGVIIQARLSSTRLPNKVLLDFHNGKNILKIIYDRLNSTVNLPVIIATTVNRSDDAIVNFCLDNGIDYYRGSEDDVLLRFIETARKFNLSHIIRVCSDNPFLDINSIKELHNALKETPDLDYISFKILNKPSILTHYGFWAELVSLEALLKAANSGEMIYHEHVTNYIYNNPDSFKIKWLKVNKIIEENNEIRLTVDNIHDFRNAQIIYGMTGNNFCPESVIEIINKNPHLKNKMVEQISKNSK